MNENKKDRSQKRMRDKYKKKKPSAEIDKKKAEIKATAEIERAQVPNNWDRYEETNEGFQDVQMDATNFNTLSSNVNESNFFQFKHEKKWIEEIKQSSSEQTPSHCGFNLNLNLLKAAIGFISVPSRCNIPLDVFTDKELEEFEEDVDDNADQYYKLIKQMREKANPMQNQGNLLNLSNLNIGYNKSTASSKLTTLVESVGTSERDVPVKRLKSNLLSADQNKKVLMEPDPNCKSSEECKKTVEGNTEPKSQDNIATSLNNLAVVLVETCAKTNRIDAMESDSDNELDFLLNLPNKKTGEQGKNQHQTPKLDNAQPMKSDSNERRLPIADKSISDDVDMDVLDSLLS